MYQVGNGFDATQHILTSVQVGDGFATMTRKLLPFSVDAPCAENEEGEAGGGGEVGGEEVGLPCAESEEAAPRGQGGEESGAEEGGAPPRVQEQDDTLSVTAVCTIEWDGPNRGVRVRFQGRD